MRSGTRRATSSACRAGDPGGVRRRRVHLRRAGDRAGGDSARALYGGPYLASAVLAATALLASHDEAGAPRPAARHRRPARPSRRWPSPRTTGRGIRARSGCRPRRDGTGWKLDGHKSFVLDGAHGVPDPGRRGHRRRAVAVRGGRDGGRAEPDRAAHAGPDPQARPAGVRRGDRAADRRAGRRRRGAGSHPRRRRDRAGRRAARRRPAGARHGGGRTPRSGSSSAGRSAASRPSSTAAPTCCSRSSRCGRRSATRPPRWPRARPRSPSWPRW